MMMAFPTGWFNAEPSLLIPAPAELIWGTLAFIVVALVIYKYAWPSYIAMLDERREKIEDGIEAAKNAQEQIEAERETLKAEIVDARKEAARIREEAQENAASIVADARTKAQDEAQRMIDQAHRQIAADRLAAETSLRTDVGVLATTLAGRIVGANVSDRDITRDVVNRFLDDLETDVKSPASSEV